MVSETDRSLRKLVASTSPSSFWRVRNGDMVQIPVDFMPREGVWNPRRKSGCGGGCGRRSSDDRRRKWFDAESRRCKRSGGARNRREREGGGTPKAPPACGKQRAPVRGGRGKRLDSRNCFNHPTAAGNADRRDLFASQFRSQVTSSDFPRFCQSAYGIAVKRIFSRSGVRLRK